MPVPKGFSASIKISAKDRVMSQLQIWIIDGTLIPGEKLIDAEIAETLGVSRTPVREALQVLEMQGLVQIHQGRETCVTRMEKQDILKMYPPFAALQSLAAELAAQLITRQQVEQLKSINNGFVSLLDKASPYRAMELDEEFHNLIVEAANNQYISSFASTLQMHIRRFKYLFLKNNSTSEHASAIEHEHLIQALEQGDSEKASRIMKQNILRPMQELYEKLEETSL